MSLPLNLTPDTTLAELLEIYRNLSNGVDEARRPDASIAHEQLRAMKQRDHLGFVLLRLSDLGMQIDDETMERLRRSSGTSQAG